jgi:hypothetical protein
MTQKILTKEIYLARLREGIETQKKLCDSNLELLKKRKGKLEEEIKEIQSAENEWDSSRVELIAKLVNPDPEIRKYLERDFKSKVVEMRNGGDPDLTQRYGQPQFGIIIRNRNRRKVMIPKLMKDGAERWFENIEVEIEERSSNEIAFEKWDTYMREGLKIQSDWTFDKLLKEIERFFENAPSIDKYGESQTVYCESGQPYQKAGE